LSLAENAEWILTKNKIVIKICDLFSMLAKEMESDLLQISLPQEIMRTTAKISKGENYKGLPYIVLDYPRLFTKENVFAIRTLFWWANYFSITLHLKGVYMEMFLEKIKKNKSLFAENDFFINTTNEWQHSLHESDYVLLKHADASAIEKNFLQNDLLKLSAKVELNKWNQSQQLILQLFRKIISVLED
jgi:hypothetical protein